MKEKDIEGLLKVFIIGCEICIAFEMNPALRTQVKKILEKNGVCLS